MPDLSVGRRFLTGVKKGHGGKKDGILNLYLKKGIGMSLSQRGAKSYLKAGQSLISKRGSVRLLFMCLRFTRGSGFAFYKIIGAHAIAEVL